MCYRISINAVLAGITFIFWAFAASSAPKDSPWGADYFPNVELVDQNGNKLHFYEDLLKDKVVAINFIYTHCGDSCPAETASLLQVQRILGDRVGKDIFFYSISVDPEHDTPEVLKAYSEKFGITTTGWKFLTGKRKDTILIRKKLGLYREDLENGNLKEHSTTIMIGNERTGQWIKRSPFDEPNVLARQLSYHLSNTKPVMVANRQSYKDAKLLPKMSKAEDLYRFRCSACHSLGSKDGLGPGLQGVTKKRDKLWLARWLKEPDKMLAEKDPIAIDLYNRYNKILMPNLRLSDSDVEALIKFMDANAKE
jgi:protein SCO1